MFGVLGVHWRNVLLLGLVFFSACARGGQIPLSSFSPGTVILPGGERIDVLVADTPEEHQQGLSGIHSEDWPENQGMLFVYAAEAPRQFWMVDTYFNLDIFFLDSDFTVKTIARDLPAHPGRSESPLIARTDAIVARYVLEMKANSKAVEDLELGDYLKFQP